MSSLYDITGIVPPTSDSEDGSDVENRPEPGPMRLLKQRRIMCTPPRSTDRCQARTPLAATGNNTEKPEPELNNSEQDLELTLACSPAYNHRKSIAREDMANIAFLAPDSRDASPMTNEHLSSPKTPTINRIKGTTHDSSGRNPSCPFDISSYVSLLSLSSPRKNSANENRGMSSLPLHCSTPSPRVSRVAAPGFRMRMYTRNFLATPQAQK